MGAVLRSVPFDPTPVEDLLRELLLATDESARTVPHLDLTFRQFDCYCLWRWLVLPN